MQVDRLLPQEDAAAAIPLMSSDHSTAAVETAQRAQLSSRPILSAPLNNTTPVAKQQRFACSEPVTSSDPQAVSSVDGSSNKKSVKAWVKKRVCCTMTDTK